MKLLLTFITLLFSFTIAHAELKEKRDVVYARFGQRELQLDWFRPADNKVYPGIILIHGGGWIGGSRKAFESTAIDLSNKGYVVANIDYRLATEAKFPGAVLDCKAAVRWMRANAKSLGVNPDKIAGIGGSAGGHLTAMVATTAGDSYFKDANNHPKVSDQLQAAIIMGAGVDQVARVKETKRGSVKNCVIFFGGELDDVPEMYAKGSPITHLSKQTSPILMLDGELDRPGERYPLFRKKMDEFEVRNQFVMIPGAKHGQWSKQPFRDLFVASMVSFLSASFE